MASKPEQPKKHTKGGPPSGEPAKATTTRVFAGNLSWETTKDGLRKYMETAGKVTSCDILLDHLGRSKVCLSALFECWFSIVSVLTLCVSVAVCSTLLVFYVSLSQLGRSVR